MLSKIKRPLLAMALVMGMGVASAYDYCAPACVPAQPRPVAVCPAPVVPAPAPVAVSCDPCAAPSAAIVTPSSSSAIVLPATQVTNYSAVRTVTPTAAVVTTAMPSASQVTYIVPSMYGTTETTVLPSADNEVERWYATHRSMYKKKYTHGS